MGGIGVRAGRGDVGVASLHPLAVGETNLVHGRVGRYPEQGVQVVVIELGVAAARRAYHDGSRARHPSRMTHFSARSLFATRGRERGRAGEAVREDERDGRHDTREDEAGSTAPRGMRRARVNHTEEGPGLDILPSLFPAAG